RPLPFPSLAPGVAVAMFDVTVSGDPPCYAGWVFLARLEALPAQDGGTNWVVNAAPGVETSDVDRDALVPGRCDHCGRTRSNRRHLYLVRHAESGELRQVGTTCVKDFLGWSVNPPFVSMHDLQPDDLGYNRVPDAFPPDYILGAAMAASRIAGGFVARSASGAWSRATADVVSDYLFGTDSATAQLRADLQEAWPEAAEVTAVQAAVVEAHSGRDHDYSANLVAALTAEGITTRQLGLVCSAVGAHQRLTAERSTPAEYSWLGEVGEPVEISGTIRTAMTVDGFTPWSSQRLVVIDAAPTLAKIYTSAQWSYDVEAGTDVTVAARVKDHTLWRGRQQTVLTRARRIQ